MDYSDSTLRRAEQLLGYSLSTTAGEREYTLVDGVLYTDIFEGDPTIDSYDGSFSVRFNGSQTTAYKNEIILNDKCASGTYKVIAAWGSDTLNTEIKSLLDWIDGQSFADSINNAGAQRLELEDFNITYGNAEEVDDSFHSNLYSNWGFYIRNPIIISVTPEQRNDYRYF